MHNPVILVAEDREDDVLLIKRALMCMCMPHTVVTVEDGAEVISYLRGEDSYANRAEYPLPDLLLLDLKMPRVDGFEVIEWVRGQPTLAALRILVLSSSNQMQDVNRAYQLGANSFLVKPNDFENFVRLSQTIQDFWLKASKAPEISREPRPDQKFSS
jgi:CheY-like chemotaxis protein